MAGPVSIASVRGSWRSAVLVYCLDKRKGDWPCHIQERCRLIVSTLTKFWPVSSGRCRCTVCSRRFRILTLIQVFESPERYGA
jgi:hypothetical protein